MTREQKSRLEKPGETDIIMSVFPNCSFCMNVALMRSGFDSKLLECVTKHFMEIHGLPQWTEIEA